MYPKKSLKSSNNTKGENKSNLVKKGIKLSEQNQDNKSSSKKNFKPNLSQKVKSNIVPGNVRIKRNNSKKNINSCVKKSNNNTASESKKRQLKFNNVDEAASLIQKEVRKFLRKLDRKNKEKVSENLRKHKLNILRGYQIVGESEENEEKNDGDIGEMKEREDYNKTQMKKVPNIFEKIYLQMNNNNKL